jgi:TrbL/VirB6 plasmid conjugal transfer protein
VASKPLSHLFSVLLLAGMLLAVDGLYTHAYALEFTSPLGNVDCNTGDSSFAVKVVFCVKMAVFATTELFLAQVSEMMIPIISAVMLLTITLLGVRIATGERDPQKMVLGTLLKFGAVWLFADNFGAALNGGLTDDVFATMEQLQATVITALYTSGTCVLGTSGLSGSYLIPTTFAPWEYIDCIFDYIFGFGLQATIASSIFGFIGSTFFSGTMGMMVFFLGIALVVALGMFAFRTVYIVLMSYIYVGLMIALSPIFIPLLMFKLTEQAFLKWLWNLIGGMAQPFFVVAYLAFAMPLLDAFVFDAGSEKSLVSTLGQGEEITKKYRLAAPVCEVSSPSDFDFFDDLPTNRIIGNILNPMDSGAMDWCGMFDFSKVDLGQEHIQELWKIGMSLVRILAVAFLILTIAGQIPILAAYVVGGGNALANSASAPILFESAIRGGLRNSMNTLSKGINGNPLFGGSSGAGSLMRGGVPGA